MRSRREREREQQVTEPVDSIVGVKQMSEDTVCGGQEVGRIGSVRRLKVRGRERGGGVEGCISPLGRVL